MGELTEGTGEATEGASLARPKKGAFNNEPLLIAVCGYPGVGKSTVSERLTTRLEGIRLRTDAIRKELFDEPTYSSTESRTVYQTTFERAEAALAAGDSVVIDASFANRAHRDRAKEVARACGVPFELLKVDCDEQVATSRIQERTDISDADVSVYYEIREAFDPIERACIRIDNSGTLTETAEQLETLF